MAEDPYKIQEWASQQLDTNKIDAQERARETHHDSPRGAAISIGGSPVVRIL